MIYPEWLKHGDRIGVTAVSDGVTDPLDVKRFHNGREKLKNMGYEVEFTDDVFTADSTGRSTDGQTRTKEFSSLINNNSVKAIISAKGGNFLNEMLEYIDYNEISHNPKWFQGYSDNTCLIHSITTKCDIATIYGNNFSDFGMNEWHKSVSDNLSIMEGQLTKQKSFDKYQADFGERVTGLEGYNEDSDVYWKCHNGNDNNSTEFSGRLLGGCLDVLLFIEGTKYDGTAEFINKYKEDGIVWYLESFETTGENLMMFLWKLRQCGWFKYTKGFVFGRHLFYKSDLQMSYAESVMYALGSLDVPIIFNSDIGHRGPRMTIVNGALARVKCLEGKGTIEYSFK